MIELILKKVSNPASLAQSKKMTRAKTYKNTILRSVLLATSCLVLVTSDSQSVKAQDTKADEEAAQQFMQEFLDQGNPAPDASPTPEQVKSPEPVVAPEQVATEPAQQARSDQAAEQIVEPAPDFQDVLMPVPDQKQPQQIQQLQIPATASDPAAPAPEQIQAEQPDLVEPQTVPQEQAEVPAQEQLQEPQEAPPEQPPQQDTTADLPQPEPQATPVDDQVMDVPQVPAMPPANVPVNENLFFDAESVIPQSQQGTRGIVRSVDPTTEPGSKFVVVSKNHSANAPKARLVSAQRALKLGRFESALEMYNELYAADPKDEAVLMGRAVTLQKLSRSDAAIQAYEELLSVDPANTEANVNMLGIIGQRYPAVATKRLLDLKAENPSNISILAQLAIVEANTGRYEEALKYLGIASGLDPRNANHLYNMAVIADRAGDKKTAVNYYEQSLEVDAIHGGSRSVPREEIFTRLAKLR